MDDIRSFVRRASLPVRLSGEISWNAVRLAEQKLERDHAPADAVAVLDRGFYESVRESARRWTESAGNIGKLAVLLPAGYLGFTRGLAFPDADIRYLGIGRHRFFLFHSAFAMWAIEKMYRAYVARHDKNPTPVDKVARKILGVLAGSAAWGMGVHLAIDVFQPKAVIFPFFGSLINGTLIDDRVWLLGNSLWCFKIGHDIFTIALGDDYERVKGFVRETFLEPLRGGMSDVVPGSGRSS